MASGIYTSFKTSLMDKVVDLGTGGDTIKVALLDNSHAFTAANDGWADVSANEISGTGYTTGGATLAGQTVAEDGTSAKWDGTDTAWSSASFTAYHAVIYDDTVTTPTADQLICSIDFGGAQTVTSGTFTIQWHSSGIITLS